MLHNDGRYDLLKIIRSVCKEQGDFKCISTMLRLRKEQVSDTVVSNEISNCQSGSPSGVLE